jgi:hypothetical protein
VWCPDPEPPIVDPPLGGGTSCNFTDMTNDELCQASADAQCTLFDRLFGELDNLTESVTEQQAYINYLFFSVQNLTAIE